MSMGPFKSGQWYDAKLEGCRRWCRLYSPDSPEFMEICHEFGRCLGIDTRTADGRLAVWQEMGRLTTCNEKGLHLKLMRWMSIAHVWRYHKD